MSKQAAAPQAGVGGERPNRARATNTAPSTQAAQPPTRHRNASVQSERRQAVPGALRDGAGASAIAEGRPRRGFQHGEPSMLILPSERKKKRPMEFCFTACCILFWLLVIIVGVAVLVIYLIYRPQPPRLRVTSATLNAGYIDELGVGEMALNSDLTVLAAISNPNTKIHIVLHYMQLDLYFHGSLIGTQAVWPAPLHEGPGGNVLRNVHVVVSEVIMSQEDVMLWRNATAKGGPVALQLSGQFHTQLNFGRWFPFKYTVYQRCTLWLDPPPSGALRRARCS